MIAATSTTAPAEAEHHFMEPQSETIFTVGGLPVTNSVLGMTVTVLVLSVLFIALRGTFKLIPSRIQSLLEMILEFFQDALTHAYGSEERARAYLPWIMTLFILIGVMNQFSLIPLVGALRFDGKELLRISTSDWSMTIALAAVSLIGAHLIALSINPLQHIGNYIKLGHFFHARTPMEFFTAFIELFIGFMEIIGEVAKIISLSARLFGNIFAGELMVVVVANIGALTLYIIPMPFIFLGIFVGLIQAFVFSFLTMLFMANTITSVHPRGTAPAHAH